MSPAVCRCTGPCRALSHRNLAPELDVTAYVIDDAVALYQDGDHVVLSNAELRGLVKIARAQGLLS